RARTERDNLDITPTARRKLIMYDWPGNVRQLENVIERSFALYPGPVLDAPEIAINAPAPTQAQRPPEEIELLTLEEIETRHIRRVLAACDNNQVAAARTLGISRSTLRRKLEQRT
ncbi:MAG: helix-turn-helix domain-containing protein, partial [Gammaproteobacteria bacterium]